MSTFIGDNSVIYCCVDFVFYWLPSWTAFLYSKSYKI